MRKKHGHSITINGKTITSRTYNSWTAMKRRCLNLTNKDYENYGGRGITICNRWLGEDGFINFLSDMGERPKGTTLDRIDNNGNYEPSNCKWSTSKQQSNNRRYVNRFGENNPMNKLTEKQIRIIKWALHFGSKQRDLAKIFNVSFQHISDIKIGRKRKDVTI